MSEISPDNNEPSAAAPATPETVARPSPPDERPTGMQLNQLFDHTKTKKETQSPEAPPPLPIDVGPDAKMRLAAIQSAENPLLEAAQPLLRCLADMPLKLDGQASGIESLRELLIREVHIYQTLCDQANLRREHVLAARYCLCTALDEAANKTPWGGGGIWASKSLLITYHSEGYGGEKVFLLIGRLSPNPQEHGQVLEVIYRILGLGFEGRYSVRNDGRKQLDLIRQQLLTLLNNQRDSVAQALSPHWQSNVSGRLQILRWLPVWFTASLFALILFGIFIWYKYHILEINTALQERIVAITIEPPAKTQVLRLKALLKDEIERGVVSVDEDARQSQVTFVGDYMFVPGKKTVSSKIQPVLNKVADEINRVSGAVTVTGHTDNRPIRTAEFPSNQVLSEKRAAEVARLLSAQGVASTRINIIGKGDSEALADNATSGGRAKNRRVDIVVTE